MAMLNDGFEKNNCEFRVDDETRQVSVWSIRDIKAGEELFVSYGDDFWKGV
jgi:SET domain-containing protein